MNLSNSATSSPTSISLPNDLNPPNLSTTPRKLSQSNPSTSYEGDSPHMDRNAFKNFREISISHIALNCSNTEGAREVTESIYENLQDEDKTHLTTKPQNIDTLATTKINVLEQADNYLRKHQQQQQCQEVQSPSESIILHKPPNPTSGLSLLIDNQAFSSNEQIQLTPLAASPRPNNSPISYHIPGAPPSARNPATIISPLTRSRTNVSLSSSPLTPSDLLLGISPPIQQSNQLQHLETIPSVSSDVHQPSVATAAASSSTVILSPLTTNSLPNQALSHSSPVEKQSINLPSLN